MNHLEATRQAAMVYASLEEFERQYPPMSRPRPEYLLVCSACGFEHGGTVGAKQNPPWVLVLWTCHNCKAQAQTEAA